MDPVDEKQYNLSGYHYGLAGATTGVVTRFLVQPLDVLKIRFQLQITPSKLKDQLKYRSIIQSLRLLVKEEGLSSLWKGHIPAQYLSVVFGAVQFSTYEKLTAYFEGLYQNKFPGVEHVIHIGTGAGAGLAASVVSFPFDVVKTHLIFQSEPKIYKGMCDAIVQIYKRDGLRGFSKGMLAACIQTTPMSGLVFCFHGIFTQTWLLFEEPSKTGYISTFGSITTGLVSGLCAKTIVYPFDLMKKRLQIQSLYGHQVYSKHVMKCRGLTQCFLFTLKNEGFFGLFKGFYPSLLKAGATNSVYFTVYDKVCQFLEYTNR